MIAAAARSGPPGGWLRAARMAAVAAANLATPTLHFGRSRHSVKACRIAPARRRESFAASPCSQPRPHQLFLTTTPKARTAKQSFRLSGRRGARCGSLRPTSASNQTDTTRAGCSTAKSRGFSSSTANVYCTGRAADSSHRHGRLLRVGRAAGRSGAARKARGGRRQPADPRRRLRLQLTRRAPCGSSACRCATRPAYDDVAEEREGH